MAPQKPAAASGRSTARPAGRSSGRLPRPAGDDDQPSAAKQVMFYGTGVLIVVVLVLVVLRWDAITAPPQKEQPKKIVKDDNLELEAIDVLSTKAAKQFAEAKRLGDDDARNRAIDVALKTLDEAQAKLEKMSEMPKYQGEEYDLVFQPKLQRIIQERKAYREAKRVR